jgi:hypothetical protein
MRLTNFCPKSSHTSWSRVESRKMVGGEGIFVGFGEAIGTMAKDNDGWPFVEFGV